VMTVTTIGLAGFVPVSGPGVHEALNAVIAEPPSKPGVNTSEAWLLPALNVVSVAAQGATFATLRTRWLEESATTKSALPAKEATPRGALSCTDVAAPQALVNPWVDPATVDTEPRRIMRTRWLPTSATSTSLVEDTATAAENVLLATARLKRAPPVAAPS